MEKTTDFAHNANTTVARLSTLTSNRHKSLESMKSPPRYESSGALRVNSDFPKQSYQLSQDPTRIGRFSLFVFKMSIDSNSQLTTSEKLNACVKGDAAKLKLFPSLYVILIILFQCNCCRNVTKINAASFKNVCE